MKKLLAALFLAGAINLSVSSGFAADFATVKDVPADFWADHDHCSAFAVADTVSYRDFPDGGSVRESAHDQ